MGRVEVRIAEEAPDAVDVVDLLAVHLGFARATSPTCHVHALDLDGLRDPSITFFAARAAGELCGVAALRELDPDHGEVKSMHTRGDLRGTGVGYRLLDHVVSVATSRGYSRVSLETGTQDEFAPARGLYARYGFVECPPFGSYTANPHSVCMTLELH